MNHLLSHPSSIGNILNDRTNKRSLLEVISGQLDRDFSSNQFACQLMNLFSVFTFNISTIKLFLYLTLLYQVNSILDSLNKNNTTL